VAGRAPNLGQDLGWKLEEDGPAVMMHINPLLLLLLPCVAAFAV